MGSGSVGHTGQASEGRARADTETTVDALIDKASRMGLTDEIRDMVDDVEALKAILHKKNAELDILELLAMQSDDDNVSELREQLFATVKLIHSDVLQTMLAEREKEDLRDDSGVWITGSSTRKPKMDKNTLIDVIRSAWYRKREMRRLMKQARQQIKDHLKNDVSPDYIHMD